MEMQMLLELFKLVHKFLSKLPFLSIHNILQISIQISTTFTNLLYYLYSVLLHYIDPFVLLLLDFIYFYQLLGYFTIY